MLSPSFSFTPSPVKISAFLAFLPADPPPPDPESAAASPLPDDDGDSGGALLQLRVGVLAAEPAEALHANAANTLLLFEAIVRT